MYTSLYGDASCWFPRSISYYSTKVPDIQTKIATLNNEINQELYLASLLHDSIVTQVEGANYSTGAEWLGHFAVDLATMLAPEAKVGATILKDVAINMTRNYSESLISGKVARGVLLRQMKKAMADEVVKMEAEGIVKLSAEMAQERLRSAAEKVALSGLKDAGIGSITRRGINVPIDLAKQLPGNWYKSTYKDVVDNFVDHFNRHYFEKIGRNAVKGDNAQLFDYYNDATKFFMNYDGTGEKVLKGIGEGRKESGWLIRQSNGRGGYFTGPGHPLGEGKPLDFWYQ